MVSGIISRTARIGHRADIAVRCYATGVVILVNTPLHPVSLARYQMQGLAPDIIEGKSRAENEDSRQERKICLVLVEGPTKWEHAEAEVTTGQSIESALREVARVGTRATGAFIGNCGLSSGTSCEVGECDCLAAVLGIIDVGVECNNRVSVLVNNAASTGRVVLSEPGGSAGVSRRRSRRGGGSRGGRRAGARRRSSSIHRRRSRGCRVRRGRSSTAGRSRRVRGAVRRAVLKSLARQQRVAAVVEELRVVLASAVELLVASAVVRIGLKQRGVVGGRVATGDVRGGDDNAVDDSHGGESKSDELEHVGLSSKSSMCGPSTQRVTKLG